MSMDDLLPEINATAVQKSFIKDVHEKAGDKSFVERGRAILAFYTLDKLKIMIESFQETVGRVAKTVSDVNASTIKASDKIVQSNERAARFAESNSKRMIWLTVGLFAATAGLLFVGVLEIIMNWP